VDQNFLQHLQESTQALKEQGLYKEEREITSPQNSSITVKGGQKVLNFCSNNYLGLADNPQIIESAKKSYDTYGFGLSSVRFICGTQTVHKELESKISEFLNTEATILYAACFDANGGLFETLLGPEDAIISDELNHASIIDGIRLCKAQRFRYKNNDMKDLRARLEEAKEARFRIIATDGVFSMDGTIANLSEICDLADEYKAIVMVDDCHAVGFMGKGGKGTIEHCGVEGRVDIITGTLGKALGGASGGYTSGRKEIVEWLRQRSRPYLFSNTLAPAIAAASITVFDLLQHGEELRKKLRENTAYFRAKMTELGFTIVKGEHPIVPVMLGDAVVAQTFARKMLDHGVYVIGFSYPVVPKNKARIRTQMSAAHSMDDLNKAIEAFTQVGLELNVISRR